MRHKAAFLGFAVSMALGNAPAAAETGRSIALVLDGSGSMNAKLADGSTRIDAAKAAVESLVGKLAPDSRLALRVYGHQSATQKKDCKDSALVVGFDAVSANKAAVIERARAIRAQGYTPINLSLQLAAKDLAGEPTAERIVLLVSDGKETCEGDPCATAKALAEADSKLVVHSIGFGVDAVTQQQLQCIARMARGKYFDARNASDLSGVLSQAAATKATAAPVDRMKLKASRALGKLKMEVASGFTKHEVIDADGKTVAEFATYQPVVDVPPGIYRVTFPNGSWTGIEVRPNETTEIKPGYLEIAPNGGNTVHVLEPETGQPVDEFIATKTRLTLIPGRFDVRFGTVLWPDGVEVKPGTLTTIKPGVLHVQSDLGVFYFHLRRADGEEVERGDVPGRTRVALPPGKYQLELDPSRWIKSLKDEERKLEVELVEGRVLELKVE